MRKYFFILLLLWPVVLFAQKKKVRHDPAYDKKPVHFGFTVGLNTMDFVITPSDNYISSGYEYDSLFADISRLSPGFNVGIVSNFKLNRYFDLRLLPGISFGQRTVYYHKGKEIFSDENRIESSFLEFPVVIKYKSKRINNFRPYLVGGVNYRIDLAARKEYDEKDKIFLRFKRSDIYSEVGFGIDFYNRYFKFSAELKFAAGIRDMLVHDPGTSKPQYVLAIDKLKSNLWILSFHFE